VTSNVKGGHRYMPYVFTKQIQSFRLHTERKGKRENKGVERQIINCPKQLTKVCFFDMVKVGRNRFGTWKMKYLKANGMVGIKRHKLINHI
jgi:hypothetical protein